MVLNSERASNLYTESMEGEAGAMSQGNVVGQCRVLGGVGGLLNVWWCRDIAAVALTVYKGSNAWYFKHA
jgi:hypothetical protein